MLRGRQGIMHVGAPSFDPSGSGGYNEDDLDPEGIEVEEGTGWQELLRTADDGFPINTVAFDNLEELLWVGTHNGRLSAFSLPDMHKYVSARVHQADVRQIRPFLEGVVSVSAGGLSIHNRCLLSLVKAPVKDILSQEPPEDGGLREEFTCASFSQAGPLGPQTPHLSVGGTRNTIWHLDMLTGLSVVSKVEVPCGTVALESNRVLLAGGVDGKIRVLDASLRTNQVERVLEACNGPISSICTWGDLLVSCGSTARPLNPYDQSPNAPTRLFPDALIRVFDLRMMRQTPPLSFSPAMVAPSVLTSLKDRLVVGSANGQFLLCDPFNLAQSDTEFFQLLNEECVNDSLSCLTASPSGEMLGFGTLEGAVIQWGMHPDVVVNLPTRPLESVPLLPPPPPAAVPVDDPAPAGRYVMRPITQSYLNGAALSSSFASTPHVMDLVVRVPPVRSINPSLLQKMSRQDFLGYVPNTRYNFKLNSLLYSKTHAQVYEVLDPRRRVDMGAMEEDEEDLPGGGHKDQDGGMGYPEENAIPRRYRAVRIDFRKRGLDGFEFGRYNSTSLAGLENLLPNTYTNAVLQLLFYVPEVRLVMLRQQYERGCYSNEKSLMCELGFLFHMLDQSQAQCRSPRTQAPLIEPGAAPAPPETAPTSADAASQQQQAASSTPGLRGSGSPLLIKPKESFGPRPSPAPCHTSNFLRVFRHIPEVVALGLLEAKASPLQVRVEAFHRFILTQLNNELSGSSIEDAGRGAARPPRNDPLGAVIDAIYGYTIRTTNTFINVPIATPKMVESRTFVVELVYPRTLPGVAETPATSTAGPTTAAPAPASAPETTREPGHPPFSQILHQSLNREARSRAWCEESKSYEPLKQVRQPLTFPTILAIHCGVYDNQVAKAVWHQLNSRSGHWLPERIRLAHDPEKGTSSLVVMERVEPPIDEKKPGEPDVWIGYDGKKVISVPDGNLQAEDEAATARLKVLPYEIMGVVSYVARESASAEDDGHLVLHVKVPKRKEGALAKPATPVATSKPSAVAPGDASGEKQEGGEQQQGGGEAGAVKEGESGGQEHPPEEEEWEWYMLNDFLVEKTVLEDALGFLPDWKEPCILLYRDEATAAVSHRHWHKLSTVTTNVSMPPTVFDAPSLAQSSDVVQRSFTPLPAKLLPGKGQIIALDAEFVALEAEKASVLQDGTRVVSKDGRQALARLSIIDGNSGLVFMDDYVLPSEPVMDYLTRFSGLTPLDLDPSTSRHHLVSARTAYLKLRYLVDRGCILVGHGLKKDFRIINIFVPPSQVIDTVDLWSLENQRKISLRFLASYLLGEHIQGETHDSIEDARTALRLYEKYLEHKKNGTFEKTVSELYDFGRRRQWKLPGPGGSDEPPPAPSVPGPRMAGGGSATAALGRSAAPVVAPPSGGQRLNQPYYM